MTAREQILAKPGSVQVVIKAKITKDAIEDPTPDWEKRALAALEWWGGIMAGVRMLFRAEGIDNAEPDEARIAEWLVEGIRKQEVWGKILRGDAV
jgi:hypothetical protein